MTVDDDNGSDPTEVGGHDLEPILGECLARLEEEGESAVEEVLARHPDLAPTLRRRLGALLERGLVRPACETCEDGLPERFGTFRIIRPLGRGGMGTVYLAEQEDLERTVALKVLHSGQVLLPGARERFRREVEAVARLRHPGIVPVHGMGEEGATPYFVMEYVEGLTLSELIRALRRHEVATLDGRHLAPHLAADASSAGTALSGPWPRVAARIVEQVADALAHAHARGVIHRDLKPSNLMLTPDGRVVVLDFGLATAEGATRLTRSGIQLGSLPYMAPEQLRGEVSDLDARVDVYALGVTLYELLTLESPFTGVGPEQLRARILAGGAPGPRTRNPTVPRDLDTVCLQAMADQREHRYRTMADFASDLRAVVETRPVAARRPSAVYRSVRWVQRAPSRAAAWGLAVLLLVGGPLAYAVFESRSAGRLRRSLERTLEQQRITEEQRALVARGYARTRQLVDEVLLDLVEDGLPQRPELLELRRRLIDEARAAYADLGAMRGSDPTVRLDIAKAVWRLGRIAREQGELDTALNELSWALAEARSLRATLASPRAVTVLEASCLRSLAHLHRQLGNIEPSVVVSRERLAVWESLAAETPDDHDVLDELAWACRDLGGMTFHEDRAEAIDLFRRSLTLRERLIVERPRDVDQKLAAAQVQLQIAWSEGDEASFAVAGSRAVGILTALWDEYPDDHRLVVELAATHRTIGAELVRTKHFAAAVEHLARAIEFDRKLVATRPDGFERRRLLALGAMNLGSALAQTDRAEESEAVYLDALSHFRYLARRQPDLARSQLEFGVTLKAVGSILVGRGRVGDGLALMSRASGYLERYDAEGSFAERCTDAIREIEERAGSTELTALARQLGREHAAEEDDAERGSLEGWALHFLKLACRAGAVDLDLLESSPDFASLRESESFKELLDDL